MEELVAPFGAAIGNAARRKRSRVSHRPLLESHPASENNNVSLSTSTTPSDDTSRVSGNDNGLRKEFNFSDNVLQLNPCDRSCESEKLHETTENMGLNVLRPDIGHDGLKRKRCSEGVLSPATWRSASKLRKTEIVLSQKNGISGRRDDDQKAGKSRSGFDIPSSETKVKKVKLKMGGITTTLHADNVNTDSKCDKPSMKSTIPLDSSTQRQRTSHPHKFTENDSSYNKKSGLQGVPWRDFATSFSLVKSLSAGKMKNSGKSETVRKSKRPPKRRVMEGVYDDEEEDEEIRYLEKLKATKSMALCRDGDDDSNKKRRLVQSFQTHTNIANSDYMKSFKEKSRPEICHEDVDYEEDELESDCEAEGNKTKQRKESVEFLMEGKKEMSLTSRQRALQSGKDSSLPAASSIEFPNGLPTAAPRKQKEKLSELEQQMKKAEAARRRRLQVEKAAKESEAEAIRKILGQDSSRKKKEDKLKKRKEELAQEKAANALVLAPNTVRWIMGPFGTTVTFHDDIDLPNIFDSKPLSYPEPREVCAGPLCTNPYKYRDSKSKLPICSLNCYKTVQLKAQTEPTC